MRFDLRRWLVARLVALANRIGGPRFRVGFVGGTVSRYVDLPHAAQVTFTYTPDEDEIAERVIRKINDRLRMRDTQISWRRRGKEPQA